MSQLRKVQEQMQQYILNQDQDVKNDRFNIYRNAYYLRLANLLRDDFAALYMFMGEHNFIAMAYDYLTTFPSSDFSIRTIGQHLAQFLEENDHYEIYYSELAEFEWLLIEVLYVEDAPVLTMESLAQVSPEQWDSLHFHLHPSVRMMECQYNTLDLWQTYTATEGRLDPNKLDRPLICLIWRRDNEAYFSQINYEEAYLLQSIANGDDFGQACENMLEFFDEEEVVQWAAQTLGSCVADGLLLVIV